MLEKKINMQRVQNREHDKRRRTEKKGVQIQIHILNKERVS